MIDALKRLGATAKTKVVAASKAVPFNGKWSREFPAKQNERADEFQRRADLIRSRVDLQNKLVKAVENLLTPYEAKAVTYFDAQGYPLKPAWTFNGTEENARAAIAGLSKLGFKFVQRNVDYALVKGQAVSGKSSRSLDTDSCWVRFFPKKNLVVIWLHLDTYVGGPAML
jgi:hypothetical protein